MSLSEKQRLELNAPLPTSAIKERKGGGTKALSYVEGWWVIDRLNAILGAGSWSYDCDAHEVYRACLNHPEKGERWHVTYVTKCKLWYPGELATPIGDHGVGHGVDRDLGLAIESALKESNTDAVKRCAKSLGRHLGLALYDKAREHVVDDSLHLKLLELPDKDALHAFLKEARGRIREETDRATTEPWVRECAARVGADVEKAVAYVWPAA